MTIQRRSERLRRKARQSMPGVTKPAAYKLYGSSYVCESEASIATSSHYKLPTDSRRARYVKSPHCLQVETSAPDDEDITIRTPIRRRNSLMETVRNSLSDSVVRGVTSAVDAFRMSPFARMRILRAPPDFTNDEGDDNDEIIDDDEDIDVTSAKLRAAYKALRSLFDIAPAHRSTAYLLLLAWFLAAALLVLGLLSSLADRPPRPPAAAQLRLASLSVLPNLKFSLPSRPSLRFPLRLKSNIPSMLDMSSLSMPSLPELPSLPSFQLLPEVPSMADMRAQIPTLDAPRAELRAFGAAVTDAVSAARRRLASFLGLAVRFVFGGAWRRRAGSVTRAEFAEELEPRLLQKMTEIAREEARSAAAFAAHRERYAADKGLPPDYALASTGASVLWARPTVANQYARFALSYARALLSPAASYFPAPPRAPTVALYPDVAPGQCWAFPGSTGALAVRLARPVVPTAFTLEHTPRAAAFATRSAPRLVRVSLVPRDATAASVRDGRALVVLGEFEFDPASGHLQTYQIETAVSARAVVLEIVANHGADHTCLYRFRVHGDAVEL